MTDTTNVRCFSYTPSGGINVLSKKSCVNVFISKLKNVLTTFFKKIFENNYSIVKNCGCFIASLIKNWTSIKILFTFKFFIPRDFANSGVFFLSKGMK